jgi:hypothetical protein
LENAAQITIHRFLVDPKYRISKLLKNRTEFEKTCRDTKVAHFQ